MLADLPQENPALARAVDWLRSFRSANPPHAPRRSGASAVRAAVRRASGNDYAFVSPVAPSSHTDRFRYAGGQLSSAGLVDHTAHIRLLLVRVLLDHSKIPARKLASRRCCSAMFLSNPHAAAISSNGASQLERAGGSPSGIS